METKIKDALAKLDPKNDNHWTAEGAPRIETLRMLTGTPSLTRDDVTKVDQSFSRTSAQEAVDAAAAKVAADKKAADEAALATNVNANGDVTGTPEKPAPDASTVVAADGTTANPKADSDNQAGSGEFVPEDSAEQVAKLKAQIAAGEDYLQGLMDERDALGKQIETVAGQLDSLKLQLPGDEADHRQNMATIQGYLQASQRRREARADLAREDANGVAHVRRQDKEPVDQRLEQRKRPQQ